MADTDKRVRNFTDRGLQSTIPKPNILRIEVLDGISRQRYLGGLQAGADSLVKDELYTRQVKDEDTVFYGFIQNSTEQGYGLSATWDTAATGGGVLGTAKAAINATASKLGVADPEKTAESVGSLLQDLTGINAKVTGSSSLKRYSNSSLTQDFTVKCGWYLPEQFDLCLHSLRILHKMIYPRKVDDKNLTEDLTKILGTAQKTATTTVGKIAESSVNIFSTILGSTFNTLPVDVIAAFVEVNKFFGRELTFDPLPVRVCVGQYMDLEPLVITNMAVSFSKETYINKEARHVPITCFVILKFNFWMNPAPDLHFLSLFGHEMFGDKSTTPAK